MTARQTLRLATAGALVSLLAACGGDSGGSASNTPGDTTQQSTFITAYTNGLKALNTYTGLVSSSFVDLFSDTFLDAGYTKAQVRDNLAAEAVATAVAPDLSLVPMVNLSNVTITNCNAANVCTMTATATNADVDTTAVTFTTQVQYINGKYQLFGDQGSV